MDIYILTQLDDQGIRIVKTAAVSAKALDLAAQWLILAYKQHDYIVTDEKDIDDPYAEDKQVYKIYNLEPKDPKTQDYYSFILELRKVEAEEEVDEDDCFNDLDEDDEEDQAEAEADTDE